LIDLHLWNEHLPEMGPDGPTVGWARKLSQLLDFPLRALANYLSMRSQLDDVVIIRAVMPMRGREQSRHLHFIAARYGFRSAPESAPRSLGDFLLVLASNPAAAHLDILLRGRAPLYLARRELDTRYRRNATDLGR
jgi:hypothetical protein